MMKQIFTTTIGGILGGVTVAYGPSLIGALVNKLSGSDSKAKEGKVVVEE